MQPALLLLGPFQATVQSAPVNVTAPAARALLTYLALETAPHSREFLAGLLWPERPREAGYANLRQTLRRLRHAAPDLVACLTISEQSLYLAPDAAAIDARRCAALLGAVAAHRHSAPATCPACLEQLAQVVELYRGDFALDLFLPDSPQFEEWLIFRREQLHQQMLGALAALVADGERRGDYEAMLRYAQRHLALEPWHEESHRNAMRALAALGQREAALAQYERCRVVLAAELGVAPAPQTQAIYEQIHSGATNGPAQHNLQDDLSPFVGRERALGEVSALLDRADVRLLTLTGAGGIGKTRLALQAARSRQSAYPDGVFMVALAGLTASQQIAPAIMAALGLNLRGAALTAALAAALRDKRMLLILDNFEHLLDGAAVAVELLAAAPRLQIIATSRESLNVRREQVYLVTGLDYTSGEQDALAELPAALLFTQAAQRVQPGFTISAANSAAVARICRLVEGLPLGLELAAVWIGTLSPAEVADEIAGNADFLAANWRDAPARQLSLRAVFNWSWALLNEAERGVLRQLAVFRGGFTREAAAAVSGASLALLASLLGKSLLRRGQGAGTVARYELHELLRQFAAEQLDAIPGGQETAAARHSAYYLAYVAARGTRMLHDQPREAAAEIRSELDNVRRAWTWAAAHGEIAALDAASYTLSQFYWLIGLPDECEDAAVRAAAQVAARLAALPVAAAARRQGGRLLSKLNAMAGGARFNQGDYDGAFAAASHAAALGQEHASAAGESIGLLIQGEILFRRGAYQAAEAQMQRALARVRHYRTQQPALEALGHIEWVIQIWIMAVNEALGRFAQAAAHGQTALELCRRENRRLGELTCLANVAALAHTTGDLAAARQHFEAAWRLVPIVGSLWEDAATRAGLGDVVRLQGEYDLAVELTAGALEITRAIGALGEQATAAAYLGRLYTLLGDYDRAAMFLARFQELRPQLTAPDVQADGARQLALFALHSGAPQEALAHATAAWELAREYSHPYARGQALVLLGHCQAVTGHPDAAASFRAALALYDELGDAALATEPRAALAMLTLPADAGAALRLIETVLLTIAAGGRAGLDEPFAVYLACYRVLRAVGDPRAGAQAQAGQHLLQQYAANIADAELRRSFLADVPGHRELLHAASPEAQGPGIILLRPAPASGAALAN